MSDFFSACRPGTWHNHTGSYGFSYCANEDLDVRAYLSALDEGPWGEIALTDHAFGLSFPQEVAWKWEWYWDASVYEAYHDYRLEKTERYLALLARIDDSRVYSGIEAEVMRDGRLSFDTQFLPHLQVLVGAVHYLPSAEQGEEAIMKEFFFQTEALLGHGIDVLAHPTRILEARECRIGDDLLDWIVGSCHAAGTAVEFNSHKHSEHNAALLKKCVAASCPFSLGTDTHRLDEIHTCDYFLPLLREYPVTVLQKLLYHPADDR